MFPGFPQVFPCTPSPVPGDSPRQGGGSSSTLHPSFCIGGSPFALPPFLTEGRCPLLDPLVFCSCCHCRRWSHWLQVWGVVEWWGEGFGGFRWSDSCVRGSDFVAEESDEKSCCHSILILSTTHFQGLLYPYGLHPAIPLTPLTLTALSSGGVFPYRWGGCLLLGVGSGVSLPLFS